MVNIIIITSFTHRKNISCILWHQSIINYHQFITNPYLPITSFSPHLSAISPPSSSDLLCIDSPSPSPIFHLHLLHHFRGFNFPQPNILSSISCHLPPCSLYHSPMMRVWANYPILLATLRPSRSSRILVLVKKSSSLVFSPRRLLEGASHSLVSSLLIRDWGNFVAKHPSSCCLSSNFFEIVLFQHYLKEGQNTDT